MSIHAQTADVLDAAADHLEKGGWYQSGGGNSERGGTCASNAIHRVAADDEQRPAMTAAHFALLRQVGITDTTDMFTVFDWNDDRDRTKQEVLDTFRASAKAERRLDDEAS